MDYDRTSAAEDTWRTAVAAVLRGGQVEDLAFRTADGLAIAPLHAPADAAPSPWRDLGRPFGILQRVDHPDPGVANAQAVADVAQGATGLVLVGADTRTSRGFGIAAADLPAILDGVAFGASTLRLELGPAAREPAVAALVALAERQGFAPESLDIDIGCDPIGELATGEATGEPRRIEDRACACATAMRRHGVVRSILRADGRVHHEAGASEAQELAAVLATALAYLRALEPLGLAVAQGSLSVTLAADADQLSTIAKFRALRRLWACVTDACGLPPTSIRVHAETAWRMLARRDPHTNVVRATLAGSAAILGGADSLTVLPFTSALGLPDAFARRLARNTPLVLLEEAHLGRVTDPAAGAGAFEAVTDALANRAWRLFQDIEADGGMACRLASGIWQREVAVKRDARRAAIAAGVTKLVGVTTFVDPNEVPPTVLQPMPPERATTTAALPSLRDAEGLEDTPAGQQETVL